MHESPTRARLLRALIVLAVAAFAAAASPAPRALAQQSKPDQETNVPFWKRPGQTPPPATSPVPAPIRAPQQQAPQQRQQQAAAPAGSPVIARIEGQPITQEDFNRIADPYFARLRADLGDGFEGDIRKIANHNVLDELLRRELLAIEARRQPVAVRPGEVDSVLMQDPFFNTGGRFDPVKFGMFKTSPGSNYAQVVPRIREIIAVNKLDESLRRRFTPTRAQVRAEYAKRNDQIRFRYLALQTRDMSLDPESAEPEWEAYYREHPDQFMRKARLRLRYARLPLPAADDSTRAAEEATARDLARAIADSLRAGTLPDTAERLVDSGLFEVPAATLPGLGRVPELGDTLALAETDTTIRVVGPYTAGDAIVVGIVAERRPKHVPPMREVLGDVKRRADAEKRRLSAEADRREFFESRRDQWRGTRASVSRLVLRQDEVEVATPSSRDVDRWYAQHGRTLFGIPDSSKAWMPPITDSLRAVATQRVVEERRAAKIGEILERLATGFRAARDPRGLARPAGAVAETLSFHRGAPPDTLFPQPMADSLLVSAAGAVGEVQGPRAFASRWVLWRVDAADTAYVPPYELVRARSDQEFAEERRRRDEEEARAHFEQNRANYRTPVRYVLDYVAVKVPPPDSVVVPEEDLRRHYEANVEKYRQEEQVRARHLLLSTREAGPGVDARAKARADSLLGAAQGGADFADLARRFSEEPGASSSGGDLGWFGRGRMVKEFEEAAFALEPGTLSPVVRTQFGYHIIRVEERKAAGQRPFEEVREEIRLQLAQGRADSTAKRTATALRRSLARGADAAALAAPHGGVLSSGPIAASEPVPALGFVQSLAQALPELAVDRWAAEPYRSSGAYVVVRPRERVAPKPAEFDEVRTQAIEDMRNAKRRELLNRKVEATRAALAAGGTLDSLAAPFGGLKDSGLLPRSAAFVSGLGNEPRVVQKAASLKVGQASDTLQVANGVAWVQLEEMKSGDPAGVAAAREQITQEMIKKGYDDWLEAKKKTVAIEILRPDLREPRPSPFKTVTFSTGGQ